MGKEMKMYRLLAALSVAAALSAATAQADTPLPPTRTLMEQQMDSLAASHKVINIDGAKGVGQAYRDSIQSLVNKFYYDQFRHFQDPAAPYFLFMSKDAQLAMGIGGCVRLRGYYDWGGAIPASGFAPYLIPMTPDPTRMRQFGTTPAGSTLFFKVIGRNKMLGDYQLYIEANFNGYQGRDFHLKKAYATVNEFTIGYANSTFSDPAALPPTVDAQGPANKISPTNLLVRWLHPFRKNWSVALSVETPEFHIAADSATKKCAEWLPDVAAFIQYQWSKSQHVRLSGILRTLSYRDMLTERNHNRVGWGLMLTSVFAPHPAWTVYANVSTGRGYESMGGDLQIGSYDLVARPGRPGEMYTPWGLGWNVALQYNIRPNLFVSANYSQSRYLPQKPVDASEYKMGQVIAVNAFWNLTPRMQVGAEFDIGSRTDQIGARRWARRVGAMAQFSF